MKERTMPILTGLLFAAVSSSGLDGQVRPDILWRTIAHAGALNCLAWSPDGRFLVSGGDDAKLRVWAASDGGEVQTLTNHIRPLRSLSFSAAGEYLASGAIGGDQRDNKTKLWRVANWSFVNELAPTGYPSSALYPQFLPTGAIAAVCGFYPGDIRFYRVPDGAEIGRLVSYISGYGPLAVSPDGRYLAAGLLGTGASRLFDLVSGGTWTNLHTSAKEIAFLPDGSQMLVAGLYHDFTNSEDLTLWRVAPPPPPPEDPDDEPPPPGPPGAFFVRAFVGHVKQFNQGLRVPSVDVFCLSPEGRYLLSAGKDNTVRLWQVASGRLVLTYDQETTGVNALAASPDGKAFAYGRSDGQLLVAGMPVVVTKAEQRTNEFHFDWQGGSGRYQVQQTSNVVVGPWEPVGEPTTNTSLTVPLDRAVPSRFFRVQSLTNGP